MEETKESVETPEMEMNFADALDEYLNSDFGDLDEGTIVSGEIVKVDKDYVLVDVNFKSEGQIPVAEFTEPDGTVAVNVGEKVDVYVARKNEAEGTIYLSRDKAKRMQLFDKLEEVQEKDGEVVGRIIRRIKGGYTVDLGGVEAFLPGSHVDLRPVPDMDALVNQEFDFKILKINRRRSNVIVSRRVLLEEMRSEQRDKLLGTLEDGQVVTGKVKNITEYGVFIDLGGLDGLLHITDMSWKRIKHPKEMVQLSDELELKILSFDREAQKVSLGLKQLVPDPWENIAEKYPEDSRFTGTITNLADYGAFVELENGVEGLVHISEMSWTRKLRHPSQMVKVGDEVEVIVLGVDPEKKRISLGMKQISPNPWDVVAEKYPEGTVLEGAIKNITEFGVFIGIEEGIDGLIHVSDISWTKKIRHPSEVYKAGDSVQAKVLTVDKENEKFTLGVKQLTEDPWTQVPAKYPRGPDDHRYRDQHHRLRSLRRGRGRHRGSGARLRDQPQEGQVSLRDVQGRRLHRGQGHPRVCGRAPSGPVHQADQGRARRRRPQAQELRRRHLRRRGRFHPGRPAPREAGRGCRRHPDRRARSRSRSGSRS